MKETQVALADRHIVAIGGSTASVENASHLLLKYILGLTKKEKPKILFVNTAQGDADAGNVVFYRGMAGLPCEKATILPFFKRTPRDLRSLTLSQDAIFVGGGNTKSALAVWREYGFDKILREAWENGVVLSGSSAGGICWFDGCVTDSFADEFTALKGLGILSGSCCPHYDGEKGRPETYHSLISSKALADGYALDECAGIHFIGQSADHAISAKAGARAYRVTLKDGSIVEEPLATTFL